MRQMIEPFYISTKGQADLLSFTQGCSFWTAHLNIFFSETTGLIELKFHMEYSLEKKKNNLKMTFCCQVT